jgi:hypothetical protein
MPPSPEQYRDDRQKVTAGVPSLSPQKRREVTENQLRLLYQRACQKEYGKNEADALAPDGAMEDTSDWEQIVGIPLEGWKVAARLKKLNRNLWFERSKAAPEQLGIYLLKNDGKGGQDKEFLCGMQAEDSPEFTLRVKNDDGTPKGIIPGWRRVLMRLIRKNIITESGAYAMFGPPSRDSENWARFTA